MNLEITKAWAAERGLRTSSPALLKMAEEFRQQGFREARAVHKALYRRCRSLHSEPMFMAAIFPAGSIEEAMEDAKETVRAYSRMSTWMKARRLVQKNDAKDLIAVCRYFRRYRAALWAREAA